MPKGVYIRKPFTKKHKANISKAAKKRGLYSKEEHRQRSIQRSRKRYKNKGRNENYLRAYGITLQDYNRILKFQKGRCGICKCKPSQVKYRFAIDHNHRTGKIRGLLCVSCNNKLGWFEIHKREAAQYLKNVKNTQGVIR